MDRALLAASWHHWWNRETPRVGPRWLDALWLLLYSGAVAAGFLLLGFALQADLPVWRSVAGWVSMYARYLVVSLVITLVIQLLMDSARALVGAQRLRGWSPRRRRLYYTLLPLLGVAIGLPLGLALVSDGPPLRQQLDGQALAVTAALSLLACAVFNLVWSARATAVAARLQASEARLSLLQAQIEPHFLFNTLATVQGLMQADLPRAQRMLETFTDYLRDSLAQLRAPTSTVGAELDQAERYLWLMTQRMDERLRYRIEADAAVRAATLPPLLLQPLVENAIRHGLEPALDGGELLLRAERDGTRLRLTVHDTGVGLDAPRRPGPPGAGIALANIRERLAQRHGSAASLRLEPASPGTRAVLELPWPGPAR